MERTEQDQPDDPTTAADTEGHSFRHPPQSEEPETEAHGFRRRPDPEQRETVGPDRDADDEPDVEAHMKRPS